MAYQYDMYDAHAYHNEMGRYKAERQLSFIRSFLHREGMSIVDIGGGSGRLAIPLDGLGHKVTVVEPSKEALYLLKERGYSSIESVHSDILSFKSTKSFDVALAIDTIKYITSVSIRTLFAKVNSLLVRNGLFIIAEINKNSWRNRISVLMKRPRPHYNIESHDGYRTALESTKFQIEKMAGFVWMPFAWNSNSKLVRVFKIIEDGINLKAWVSQSPWLLIAARKIDEATISDVSNETQYPC